jgi:hypothetical protein
MARRTMTIGAITDLGGVIAGAVQALAYCPPSGSDASIADVLFAAVATARWHDRGAPAHH